jgi:MGT family glycosyltransferase
MARYLLTVWPFRSHYFPMLAMADAVRRRGHEVAFYTGPSARADIEDEGFGFFPFQAVDEERIHDLIFSRGTFASWSRPRRLKALLREWLLGTVPDQVRDLEPILDVWQPDVIVAETSTWGPTLILHEARPVPVAVFSTVVSCLIPGPQAPLVGLGLPRPRGPWSRALARLARSAVEFLSVDFRREVNRIRERHGLSALDCSVTEFAGRMPLYLVPGVPEFDFERTDLPPSVHYFGPCLWRPATPSSAPPWLAPHGDGRPWVHVTEGTMHTRRPILLQAAARGLGERPVRVTMDTGGRAPDEMQLGEPAPNVRVESWVPHELLLPHIDLMVTTGGAGTVMSALQAGVPLIVVPTEWDKPENAQRVAESGVGLRLAPNRCTPRRLRQAVETVLADPGYRDNARQLSRVLGKYAGPPRAAELLELLCAERPPAAASVPA